MILVKTGHPTGGAVTCPRATLTSCKVFVTLTPGMVIPTRNKFPKTLFKIQNSTKYKSFYKCLFDSNGENTNLYTNIYKLINQHF